MNSINVTVGNTDYEFYDVPDEVARAIITLLYECENDESGIVSAESER